MMSKFLEFDIKLFYLINHIPHHLILNMVFLIIDYLTSMGIFWIILLIAKNFSKKKTDKLFAKFGFLIFILVVFIEGLVIKTLIVRRTRPYDILDNAIVLGIKPLTYSFPSGQASISFAITTLFWAFYPKSKTKYILLIFSILGGIGRIYLGAHFPSDVIGGAIIGCLISILTIKILKKYLIHNKTTSEISF